MSKMRVAQVARPGGSFEIVEREIPQPAPGWVRVKVQACGICHSDSLVKEGHWPGIQYPRVPGHEVVGIVDAVGAGVTQWQSGQRVGVGWHGGHCGMCDACRNGDFLVVRWVCRSRAFLLTVAMVNTWLPRPSPWHWCRTALHRRTLLR